MFGLGKEKRNEYAYDTNQKILQAQLDELREIIEEHQKRIDGLLELMKHMQNNCTETEGMGP